MNATFKTFLPVFSGFYNTIFDESDSFIECETSDEESFRDHYPELNNVPFDFIREHFWDTIDYASGNRAVCGYLVNSIGEVFPDGLIIGAKMEKIVSPREYNFYNDSIDCEITVDLELLHSYLAENTEAFIEYLRKSYTSRSGFMSSYPNDQESWREDTEGFTKLDGHYLGSILQFIAFNEDEEADLSLYYTANGSEAFSNGANIDAKKIIDAWKFKNAA